MPLVAAVALAVLLQLAPQQPIPYSQLEAVDARINGRTHVEARRTHATVRRTDPPRLRPAFGLNGKPPGP